MIVLGLPAVSFNGNLKGDSGFLEIYRPLVAMSERYGICAYVQVPSLSTEAQCAALSTPRVRVDRNGVGIWSQWFPDLHRFSVKFARATPVDLVFTQHKHMAQMLRSSLSDSQIRGETMPVVLDILKVGLNGQTHGAMTTELEQEEAGALLCSWPIVSTGRERDLLVQLARKSLSPAMVHQVMTRVQVLPDAIADVTLTDVATRVRGEGEPVTVAYVGRLNHTKMYMRALEIADRAFQIGTPIKVVVITNSRQMRAGPLRQIVTAHPHVQVIRDVGKDAFLALLPTIDIVVNASLEEGYSVTTGELLASGKIIVLPDRAWAHVLAGREYPFFYRSLPEAVAHVQWLATHLDSPKVQAVRAAMRERYAADTETRCAERLHRLFERVLETPTVSLRPMFVAQRAAVLAIAQSLGARFTWDEFRTQYMRTRTTTYQITQRGTAGPWYWYKWLCAAGYTVETFQPLSLSRDEEAEDAP